MKNKHPIYYQKQDYAGFWKRLGAWIVDLLVIIACIAVYWYVVYHIVNDPIMMFKIIFFTSLLFMYVYLAVIKSSNFRTIGYNLFGIKVVDLLGNSPNWSTMLIRFLLIFIGPFTFIIDILWLTGEQTKQTLRDKYAGTYVVKNTSIPKGTGLLRTVSLHFMGWNLSFKEVYFK